MGSILKTKILTTKEIEFFQEKIQVLLSTKGIHIEHSEVMALLQEAGAEVSPESGLVKFPIPLIEKALKQVPRKFTLAGIDPKYDMEFPHPQGLFYTRTCTGGMFYLNENDEYHHILLDEVAEWTRLIEALDNIDFWSLPSTNPVDFPAETIDIHTLNTVLRNTKKHGWVQPYEANNIKYLIEMAAAVVGGKDELRKRPIISAICCSVPALSFKYMDMNILYECCKAGVPIQACSLPAAGANVPITPSGIVLVASAEVLAMIIMAQLIAPGTPCIATPLLFEMDMQTTVTTQASIATTISRMMAMQLFAEGYDIPAHTYGTGTDSCLLDGQSGFEQASISHMVALSGASILGGAGQLETAKTISPQQLVIDNDIFGMVRQLKRGYVVDEETVGWDDIISLSGTDGFINKDHTYRYFRDGYRAKTFSRDSKTTWEGKGSKDIAARAKDYYLKLKNKYTPMELTKAVTDELDAIVTRADKELRKK